jgi:allantoinase
LLRDRVGSLNVGAEPGSFTFDASKSLSAVQWSSFDGREMRIRMGATFVRGALAYDGEKMVNRAGHGRFLRPHAGAGSRTGNTGRPR